MHVLMVGGNQSAWRGEQENMQTPHRQVIHQSGIEPLMLDEQTWIRTQDLMTMIYITVLPSLHSTV